MIKDFVDLAGRVAQLPVNARGHRSYDQSLKNEIVDAFRTSNLTCARFAKEIGISAVLLDRWTRKTKKTGSAKPAITFPSKARLRTATSTDECPNGWVKFRANDHICEKINKIS